MKLKHNIITEHSIQIKADLPQRAVHKGMEVFYNPVMQSNRNIAILLLNSIPNQKMNIVDPLAGSGIRSLRFLKELKKGKINHIFINDHKESFVKVFKENVRLNKLKPKNITLGNEDATLFLLNQINLKHKPNNFCGYFDYIDIDPFGSPNSYLNAALARITRGGILAVTATDTAALTGTYPKVTRRKYDATPLRNYLMHEIGLRILIRKVQLLGVQFDKALIPILCYSKDHYYRLYFRNEKGKQKCDEIIKQHRYFLFCTACLNFKISYFNNELCTCKKTFQFSGPLWTRQLHDHKLITAMAKNNPFPEEQKFLDLLREESTLDLVGFYDLHVFARKFRKEASKLEPLLTKVKGVRTHFSPTGIKSKVLLPEIVKIIK